MKMTTLEKLQGKASAIFSKHRMPSIDAISEMLKGFDIKHEVYNTTNVVEHRSGSNRYVNSRYNGKNGKKLEIPEARILMDSSSSYYSHNTYMYANDILKFLELKGKI